MERRTFLKIVGATPVLAAVPVVPGLPVLDNVVTVTVNALSEGTHIGIFDATTREKLFLGTSTDDKVVAELGCDEPREIIVRARKPGYKALSIEADTFTNPDVAVRQIEDTAWTQKQM